MNLILLAAAFCIGVAMSAQAAVNSQLAHSIGTNSIMAALISFSCGTVALLVMALAKGGVAGLEATLTALPSQPAWKFLGGFMGAAFVLGTVFLAPRIGLLTLVVLVIAGQLLSSMAIDHFGLINMARREVSPVRLTGALVVALGVTITVFGDRIVASLSR